MDLTARQLNRATLGRQLLLRRERLDVVDAVRRVVALQAQEAASPYLALWNRVAGFDPAELDAAFAEHAVVKATLMRITLHAVAAEDYPAFHAAMLTSLRAARLLRPALHLDRADRRRGRRADAAPAGVRGASPAATPTSRRCSTSGSARGWASDLGGAKPGPWWALRTFAPLVHAPTGGPWSFGPRPSYVAARDAAASGEPGGGHPAAGAALPGGLRPGHGARRRAVHAAHPGDGPRRPGRGWPARWSGCPGRTAPSCSTCPAGSLPAEDVACPPRLMAMWDSTLLAYADRSRIIPPDYRRLVIRQNGDVLPTLLVDGYVAGVWRPGRGRHRGHRVPPAARPGLAGAGGRGPAADGLPRRPRPGRLPPLLPLVGRAARRRGGSAA